MALATSVVALSTAASLHEFVKHALCEHDRLDPAQTPFFRTDLKRRDKQCGLLFHVEGPRLLKNSAIWAEEENRIIFYDSNGIRFQEVKLSEAPALDAPSSTA